ncbi:MAG: glycosyltransferase family 4 protein [Candidatus Dormibacteraceae bacterium]
MRIALVTREFPPTRQAGGIATYTEKTSRALAGAGHEVHVFSEAHPLADRDEDRNGVSVHRLADPGVRPREARAVRRAIDVALALRRQGRFDVVQACEWEGEAAFYASFPHAPLITRLATPRYLVDSLNQTGGWDLRRAAIARSLERWQTRHSTAVFSPSAALADVVARDWVLDRARIKVVPTGIELPLTADGPLPDGLGSDPYLLYFGRLEMRKGVKTWIDALPEVLRQNPGLDAVFAGDDLGTGRETFVEYGHRRCGDLAPRLRFLPRLSQRSLFPLIRSARLVVLPSRWESLANACLEAMALGRAVVATRGSGFAETIEDGDTGWLVPPDDAAALASAVNRALADPARLEAVGAAAGRRAHDFSLECMVDRLVDIYQQVVEARHGFVSQARAT